MDGGRWRWVVLAFGLRAGVAASGDDVGYAISQEAQTKDVALQMSAGSLAWDDNAARLKARKSSGVASWYESGLRLTGGVEPETLPVGEVAAPDDDATFRRDAVRPHVVSTKMKAGATREQAEAEADSYLADPESAAFVSRFRDIIAEQAQVIGAAMTS